MQLLRFRTVPDITPLQMLLQTLKTWPQDIYDLSAVINAIRSSVERMTSSSESRGSPALPILMECLVELHLTARQPGKALPYYLRLKKPGVFDLIRDNNLFVDVKDQVLLLVDFEQDIRIKKRRARGGSNEKQTDKAGVDTTQPKHGEAIELLVDHTHSIPVSSGHNCRRMHP